MEAVIFNVFLSFSARIRWVTQRNYFRDLCPEISLPSWGVPGSFFGLPVGFLTYERSPQEATNKFQTEILEIISLVFWKKQVSQVIIKSMDL